MYLISMMKKAILSPLLNLFYPKLCEVCDEFLFVEEEQICTTCLYEIPKTNFHLMSDNQVAQLFWGRVEVDQASSFFHYKKGSKYQQLLHKLKYKGKKEIGLELGKLFGYDLMDTTWIEEIDLIIPVPLHPKREKQRGYNQSDWIAMGLSSSLAIPWSGKILVRQQASTTQTRKSRFERFENVHEIFAIKNDKSLKNKHVLLVDDVVTTGSTLEACAATILSVPNTRVSIVTLAIA